MCYLLDIFPTLGHLANVSPRRERRPQPCPDSGWSPTKSVYGSIFTAYTDVQRAVRNDRRKLIVYPEINTSQLFDLARDPGELHDLANDPQHAREHSRLYDLLRDWQKKLGDSQPLSSPSPRPKDFDFSAVEP